MLPVILLAVLLPSLTAADSVPDFSGRWKLRESGKTERIHGPRNIVFEIQHSNPHFRYKATGIMAIQTPFEEVIECSTDGKEVEEPDANKLTATGRWQGRDLVLQYRKNGRQVAVSTLQLSPDGKQLTRSVSIPGKQPFQEIYDKQ